MTELIETRGNFSHTKSYTFSECQDPQNAGNKYAISVVRLRPTSRSNGSRQVVVEEVEEDIDKNSIVVGGGRQVSDTPGRPGGQSPSESAPPLWARWFKTGQRLLADVFLPFQYPESVSSDYLTYQIWDDCAAFCYSVGNTFATRAMYEALGVGDAKATSLAAATVILLQDGSRWMGTIFFSWLKGRAFDYNNKKWRFASDIVTDLTLSFQLTYPLYSREYLIYIFCGTSFVIAFHQIAASATRVSLVAHQAKANNESEVKAKNVNQDQSLKLIGLGLSLGLLHAFGGNTKLMLGIFITCVALHIILNFIAIKCIYFESLNEARLLHALKYWFTHGRLPTLKQVNRMESIILGLRIRDSDVCGFHIRLGVQLHEAFALKKRQRLHATKKSSLATAVQLKSLIQHFTGKKFLIIVQLKKKRINVVLHQSAQPVEIIEAYVRSVLIGKHYSVNKVLLDVMDPSITEQWSSFRAAAEKEGFQLDRDLMGAGNWRAEWSTNADIDKEGRRIDKVDN